LACPKLLQVPAKGVPFPAKAKHRRLQLLALALVTLAPVRQFLDDQCSFLGCDGVPLLDVFDVKAMQILGVVEGVEVPHVRGVPAMLVLRGEVGEGGVALSKHPVELLHLRLVRLNEESEAIGAGLVRTLVVHTCLGVPAALGLGDRLASRVRALSGLASTILADGVSEGG
jgi:hypothetical protein